MQTTPATIAIAVATVETVLECTHHLGCSVLVIAGRRARETVRLRSSRTDDPGSTIVDRRALRPDYAAIARAELQTLFDADTDAQLIDRLRNAGLDIAAGAL